MNKQYKNIITALLPVALLIFITILLPYRSPALARHISPTPTYDPQIQPPLPLNPTEYELGRYLYWRHCMPCHGDRGQGLTDEFRAVWVADHQDCWGRGCHSGKWPEKDSFPIPTVVPALVKDDQLTRFPTQQGLFEYLKTTHPPQDPGFLEDEEYYALAFFIFVMNDRLPVDSTPTPAFTPTLGLPPLPQANPPSAYVPAILLALILLASIIVIAKQKRTEVRAPGK